MSIRYFITLLAMAFLVQPAFANEEMPSQDPACATIVKSCLDAGYTRDGAEGKQFWMDCMRPLLLGKSVSGVAVAAKDVKACRTAKIAELKRELSEMKAAK